MSLNNENKQPRYDENTQISYERELQMMGIPVIPGIGPGGPKAPKQRLVHIDMKGAPPKLSFLCRLLPIIKMLGATGLLIEYEDMFPYTGAIESIKAKNAYESIELKNFLKSVSMHGLTVIPLVQTFGHLEFVLKLQEFAHLRETPDSPQSICPSQKISFDHIAEMLTQITEFHLNGDTRIQESSSNTKSEYSHSSITHIHIGCDEVYRLGICPKCQLIPRNKLFLVHVKKIADFLKAKWPFLKVIIWDDMLRTIPLNELQMYQFGDYVEPMIWAYAEDLFQLIQPLVWDKYSKAFSTAWTASAFKGAFGEDLMVVPIEKHLKNNLKWLSMMAEHGSRFCQGLQGIALTGWQRYDHFSILCELLPAALPSLFLNLATISKGYFNVDIKQNPIFSILEHPGEFYSSNIQYPWINFRSTHDANIFETGVYIGSEIYKLILELQNSITKCRNYLYVTQVQNVVMSEYNIRHNFGSTIRVTNLIQDAEPLIQELTSHAHNLWEILDDVFDKFTIGEFIEQRIYPVIINLRKHIENGQKLLLQDVWPRRPLPYENTLFQLNLLPRSINSNNK